MTVSAARARSKKLAVNLNLPNALLEELDELCIASVDAYEIEDQISISERLYLETEVLLTELLQNLEEDETRRETEDWSKYRKTFRLRKAKARALICQLQREQEDRLTCGDGSNPSRVAVWDGNGKLPKMKLPQFSMEVLEFPTFWAQFEASVHERYNLDVARSSHICCRALKERRGAPLMEFPSPRRTTLTRWRS
ncbi:hypothetical protein T07_12151 [Trichinella nelsoni]|uniref:Uncharacterized protein n=1 Tax=Trichinella nelsoni TaxID=6336 RepID=A0A0V0S6B2_9BILA|nr:hypothetical protein T07_12151 [Trichinella nelsoni]